MSNKEKIVTNSDDDWLDEFNGPGAEEIQGFVPTRHELIQLVKYWAKVELDLDCFMFIDRTKASDLLRQTSFAQRRIGRIAELLRDDEVIKTINEVGAEILKHLDKRHRDIFLNYSEEQREAVRKAVRKEEVDEEMLRRSKKVRKQSN